MSHQTPQPDPLTSGPHDPEHDPSASYALEPDYVAALTGRIVSTSGESKLSVSPINNQPLRSEEHTSELQSLMRISYAVFCLKKKKNSNKQEKHTRHIKHYIKP